MAALQQTSLRNQLLAGLLPEDFALLQPHLDPIALALRRVLLEPKQPIEHVYFQERGYTSVDRWERLPRTSMPVPSQSFLLVEDEVLVRMAGTRPGCGSVDPRGL
jgi:hypothetical protein